MYVYVCPGCGNTRQGGRADKPTVTMSEWCWHCRPPEDPETKVTPGGATPGLLPRMPPGDTSSSPRREVPEAATPEAWWKVVLKRWRARVALKRDRHRHNAE